MLRAPAQGHARNGEGKVAVFRDHGQDLLLQRVYNRLMEKKMK